MSTSTIPVWSAIAFEEAVADLLADESIPDEQLPGHVELCRVTLGLTWEDARGLLGITGSSQA